MAILAVSAVLLLGCSGDPNAGNRASGTSGGQSTFHGETGSAYDQTVRNAFTDIEDFWSQAFPTIAGGRSLQMPTGGIWSVETNKPDPEEKCMADFPTAANDNSFYCAADDAFAYDRVGLPKLLADKMGVDFVPLVFAHEFGHLVQNRLGIHRPTILLESQADCSSGAFMAAEAGRGPITLTQHHFTVTRASLDVIAVGMIVLRDFAPHSAMDQGTHGTGFDRIGAFADGYREGVARCFGPDWANRRFTQRSYDSVPDQKQFGNETLQQVLDPRSSAQGGGGLQPDLNKFWTSAASDLGQTFQPVRIKAAEHPPCVKRRAVGFAYCSSDNTIYYRPALAASVYNSVPMLVRTDSQVTLNIAAPGDFALGTLFAYGWAMAVRSQLHLGVAGVDGLIGASCFVGAYANHVNAQNRTVFALSPQDMDEGAVTVLRSAAADSAFGARGTTGLDRIAAFNRGYLGGVNAC